MKVRKLIRKAKRGIRGTSLNLPGGVSFNPLLGVPTSIPSVGAARGTPTLRAARANYTTMAGYEEALRQPLYDYQVYPQAGALSFKFFQVPQGQGGKTIHDTNMESAGQLPSPKAFLATSIEIFFFPGTAIGAFGAQAAATFSNDVYNVMKAGHVQIFLSSKTILDEAPLMRCPPATSIRVDAALADVSTAGADKQSRIDYATANGPKYMLDPGIVVDSNQNFSVDVTFSAAVPITVAGRIGIVLGGILYRKA